MARIKTKTRNQYANINWQLTFIRTCDCGENIFVMNHVP